MAETKTSDERADRFWTLPNAFSLLRVVLTPPAVWLIAQGPDYVWQAFGVVAVMIVSDVLDGHLARRWHEVTRWGKVLDPLADKVGIGAIALVMVMHKGLPVWVAVAVLVRDVLIVLAGIFLVRRCGVVISSNLWGKLTTLVMSFLLLAYLWDVDVVKPVLLWLSGALLLVSWLSYGARFVRMVRGG